MVSSFGGGDYWESSKCFRKQRRWIFDNWLEYVSVKQRQEIIRIWLLQPEDQQIYQIA